MDYLLYGSLVLPHLVCGDVEKFLHTLRGNHGGRGLDSGSEKTAGFFLLFWLGIVLHVDKNVRVEKAPTAHKVPPESIFDLPSERDANPLF